MRVSPGLLCSFSLLKLSNAAREAVEASKVPDIYIVTLKPEADTSLHVEYVANVMAESRGNISEWRYEGISYQYHIQDFKGYAGHFDPMTLERLKNHHDVAHVESDYAWTSARPEALSAVEEADSTGWPTPESKSIINQTNAPWGLHDISHKEQTKCTGLSGVYWYDSTAGKGTYGYVLDSGIKTDHVEFEGRASLGFNAIGGPFIDDEGHGTHVASTIGGKTYGVAKKCSLIAVKISRKGTQYTSTTIEGFSWAAKDIKKKAQQPRSVINISSSVPFSLAYNRAVDAAAAWGISTIVSAGNQARECDRSPASSSGAIAVGATTFKRRMASFSNYGKNVTIFAPGVAVPGAWIGFTGRSTTASVRYSGTSMSAPHVSGLVLYFKALKFLPTAKMTKQHLLKVATQGMVKNAKDSPNVFVYNGSGK